MPFSIVAVDDGSTDGTYSALTQLQKSHPEIRVVRHPENKGLGAALRTGFSLADGDWILTLDGDLTFHPNQIALLLKEAGDDVSAVLGSPSRGQMKGVPFVRRLLSDGVNMLYRLLLGADVSAASSIFRLYRAADIKNLHLTQDGFDLNAELLFSLLRQGRHIKEVPVTLTVRTVGESKINVGREIGNHLKMLVRIAFWRARTLMWRRS